MYNRHSDMEANCSFGGSPFNGVMRAEASLVEVKSKRRVRIKTTISDISERKKGIAGEGLRMEGFL